VSKQCFSVDGAPPALGPYSHAVRAGKLLFVSGQVPLRPDGSGMLKGTIEEETHQVMANVRTVLEGAGANLGSVVKSMVFLDDMENFAAFNAVYGEYFPTDPPARSCVQVAGLPGGAKVEVEVVALLPDSPGEASPT